MNIHEKHTAYTKLKTTVKEIIERDIALLKIKNPQSPALQVITVDIPRKGQEVLWDLLDVASAEEIEDSRNPKSQEQIQQEIDFNSLKTDNESIIEKDIALLAEIDAENEVLAIETEDLVLKGEKVLEQLVKKVPMPEILLSRISSDDEKGNKSGLPAYQNPPPPPEKETQTEDVKKKAKETSTQTSDGEKTNEKTSKKP